MKKGLAGVLGGALGILAGSIVTGKVMGKTVDQKVQKVDKFKGYYNMLNQWLALKQEGKSLETYFLDNGYKTIAIYGMGEMGNRLYDELKHSDVDVKYAVDKNASTTYSELEVKELDDNMEKVDVVIVTATFAFEEIVKEIDDKFRCSIVSLEDVVYNI